MILKKSLCCTCAVFSIILWFDSTFAYKLRRRDTTENGKCAPLNIVNGDYNVLGSDHEKGTPIPNYAIVNISCNVNYGLYPSDPLNICINGEWRNQPECKQLCPPRISTSVNVTCTLNGKDVNCTKPVDGTVAHSRCNRFYSQPYDGFPTSKCSGGSWDIPLIRCEPECGQLIPNGGTYIVGGHDAVRGEFPWHVGLYRFNASKSIYEYQCAGSIITPLFVITVAHCVANNEPEEFYVAAGKYYSNYDAPEDNLAQKRQVNEYKIPREYRGYYRNYEADLAVLVMKQAFTLSNVVQPVCVDWNSVSEEQQLKPQKLGHVVGWGFTDPGKLQVSETLKQLTAPYIDRLDCLDAVPQNFQRWVTHDKFCAGFANGSSVCKGDSGGGLVFKWMDNEKNKIKYYLRGLVSVGPLNNQECDNYKYGVYTKISSYIEFITQVVAENKVSKLLPPRRSTAVTVKVGACAPLNITNGDYNVLGSGHIKGSPIPNFAIVNITCNANYSLHPSDPVNTCINGEWINIPVQQCRQLCPPRLSISVNVTCTLDGRDVNCTQSVVDGTVAESRCNDFYTQSGDDLRTSTCSGGTWDKPLIRCEPECGQRSPSRRKRLAGGHDAVRGEFPWQIGLYRVISTKYYYLCGGSIITPLVVITAAHCVTMYSNEKYPAENFYVAAGKYYSNYNAAEDNLAQKIQVKEYRIPLEYRSYASNLEGDLAVIVLKEPFQLTHVVQPVCVDWNSDFEEQQLKPAELGYIVGWGYSETLKQLTVAYIDRQKCLDALPQDLQQYVTHDKFCAGRTNGCSYVGAQRATIRAKRPLKYINTGTCSSHGNACQATGFSVCNNDDGNGIAFKFRDNRKEKYYLRGLVSNYLCYNFGHYTKISAYMQLIKQVVSENKLT